MLMFSRNFLPSPIWHNVCIAFKLLNCWTKNVSSDQTNEERSLAQLHIIWNSVEWILQAGSDFFRFFVCAIFEPAWWHQIIFCALAVLDVNENWKIIAVILNTRDLIIPSLYHEAQRTIRVKDGFWNASFYEQ